MDPHTHTFQPHKCKITLRGKKQIIQAGHTAAIIQLYQTYKYNPTILRHTPFAVQKCKQRKTKKPTRPHPSTHTHISTTQMQNNFARNKQNNISGSQQVCFSYRNICILMLESSTSAVFL